MASLTSRIQKNDLLILTDYVTLAILRETTFKGYHMSKRIVIPAEVFSRVSGYFRPVNQWNNGKREEFSQRRYVDLRKTLSVPASNMREVQGIIS